MLSGFSPMGEHLVTEKQDNASRDEVLKRMLKMKPKPHKAQKPPKKKSAKPKAK
jgi:hypothetical protein